MRPSTVVIATLSFAAVFLVFGSYFTEVTRNYGTAEAVNSGLYANVSFLTGQTGNIERATIGGNGSIDSSFSANTDSSYASAFNVFGTVGYIGSMINGFWTSLSLDGQIALILVSILVAGVSFTLISAILRYVL